MTNRSSIPLSDRVASYDYDENIVREALINLLRRYPRLSKTMINSHIAPYGSQNGVAWNDIFQDLIEESVILPVETTHTSITGVRKQGTDYILNPEYLESVAA